MGEVRILRTGELEPGLLTAVRAMLDRAFEGDFDDDDWDHGLGGWHVLVLEGEQPLAHAAVVERPIEVDGRRFRGGYVEGVATDPHRQGEGHGTAAMAEVGAIILRDHELGVLGTGEWAFYERLGWERWRGRSEVRRADGTTAPTPEDDDALMVLRTGPSAAIGLDGVISCEERPGDDW